MKQHSWYKPLASKPPKVQPMPKTIKPTKPKAIAKRKNPMYIGNPYGLPQVLYCSLSGTNGRWRGTISTEEMLKWWLAKKVNDPLLLKLYTEYQEEANACLTSLNDRWISR